MSGIAGFTFLAVAAGSAALTAGRKILERRRARRLLRERPELEATSPEGSEVRVTGVVRVLDETLEAPLSGRRCVVFRSRVYAKRRMARVVIHPQESLRMVTFLVERADGSRVTVDGKHVLLDLDPIKVPADQARRTQLALGLGLGIKELRGAHYEEVLVEEGMRVSIAGLMMKDVVDAPPTTELAFRETAAPALRIAGNATHPLVVGAI